MEPCRVLAGKGGPGSVPGRACALRSISRTAALATLLVAGVGVARAAESNDGIVPPSPSDIAMLRSLLALQHPALRQDNSAAAAPAPVAPNVESKPRQENGQTS